MKKPNFFILGAPKCGTTSMAAWLSEHPRVYMSPSKEPHYFDTDHNNCNIRSMAEYLALFEGAPASSLAIGEASVFYLCSNVAVGNILTFAADAKFVLMLRNPIDMAHSLHHQLCFNMDEHVVDFEEAWNLQEKRASGNSVTSHCQETKFLVYGEICQLGAQLKRLYSQVSRERVHIVVFDDLKTDPCQEYQRVLAFLGVPDDGRQDFPLHNPAKERRSRPLCLIVKWLSDAKKGLRITKRFGILNMIDRGNTRARQRPPLKPEMRRILIEYFTDDIQLLEALLGRDLSHWLQ